MTELPAAPPPANPLYDPRCNRDLPIPGAGCNRGMWTCQYPECTFPETATPTAAGHTATEAPPPPPGDREEADRIAIGAALIRSGIYDDKADLLQRHPCVDCPRPSQVCSCSGVPYISDEVWRELGPVIAAIRTGVKP